MLRALINFFTGQDSLNHFIESQDPKNISDVETLCRLWIQLHQDKFI